MSDVAVDGMTTGPMPGSLLPCGCHIRRPDYEAILCAEHVGDMGHPIPAVGVIPETGKDKP